MRAHVLIPMALALAACGESFDPPSLVTDLRVLAVRAEPPEIAPAGSDAPAPPRATLTALVADPQHVEPARPITVVYLACTPKPGSAEPSICNLVETYADPGRLPELLASGALACEAGGEAPPEPGMGVVGGISFAGMEVCEHVAGCGPARVEVEGVPLPLPPPAYELPEGFTLDDLPAGHRERTLGVQVLTVAIAVAASPDELVAGADPADFCAFAATVASNLGALLEARERRTVIKRITVRGPDNDDEHNINPLVPGLFADGRPLPADPAAAARFARRTEVGLRPAVPADGEGRPIPADELYQPYTFRDAEGRAFRAEREAWVWSWFATAGAMERERTRDPGREQVWTTPGGDDRPVPRDGRVFLYAVVRDARGGMDWVRREVRVE